MAAGAAAGAAAAEVEGAGGGAVAGAVAGAGADAVAAAGPLGADASRGAPGGSGAVGTGADGAAIAPREVEAAKMTPARRAEQTRRERTMKEVRRCMGLDSSSRARRGASVAFDALPGSALTFRGRESPGPT